VLNFASGVYILQALGAPFYYNIIIYNIGIMRVDVTIIILIFIFGEESVLYIYIEGVRLDTF